MRTLILDTSLVLCNLFFIFNGKLGLAYCQAPLSNTTFQGALALDFCKKHNPAFCARPEWMRMECCIDGYFFIYCYIFTIYVILSNSWWKYKNLILIYFGAYMYSLIFTYNMYLTFPELPSHALPFYASVSPYPIAMLLMVYKALKAKSPNFSKSSTPYPYFLYPASGRQPVSPSRHTFKVNYKKED